MGNRLSKACTCESKGPEKCEAKNHICICNTYTPYICKVIKPCYHTCCCEKYGSNKCLLCTFCNVLECGSSSDSRNTRCTTHGRIHWVYFNGDGPKDNPFYHKCACPNSCLAHVETHKCICENGIKKNTCKAIYHSNIAQEIYSSMKKQIH